MDTAWSGDWQNRLLKRIRAMGYRNVTDYLEAHPGVPYHDVAKDLGRPLPDGKGCDIAAIQIQGLQYLEAVAHGKLREFAMDSLVRILRDHLRRKGWNEGVHAKFNRACAYAAWCGLVSQSGEDEAAKMCAAKTWEALEQLSPPQGWRPSSPDDPYVVAAFNKGWPREQGT